MIKYFTIVIIILSVSCSDNKNEEITRINDIKKIASKALEFCKKKKFNTDFCMLINMGIHSGMKRFFVYDFKKGRAIDSGMVSHGCCGNDWSDDDSKDNPEFSAIEDSHCSSLGKYRISERGVSKWGIKVKYLLYGLEKSNRTAMKRALVLHSWDAIPHDETYPDGIPEGWGCPAVSNEFMKKIDNTLLKSEKPVLMWIFK